MKKIYSKRLNLNLLFKAEFPSKTFKFLPSVNFIYLLYFLNRLNFNFFYSQTLITKSFLIKHKHDMNTPTLYEYSIWKLLINISYS